jgi:hypothetical protein
VNIRGVPHGADGGVFRVSLGLYLATVNGSVAVDAAKDPVGT